MAELNNGEHVRRERRTLIKWCLIVVLILSVIKISRSIEHYETLSRMGYCEKEGRIFTNSERLKIAVEYMNNLPISIPSSETNRYFNLETIKYKDFDEILQKNPECCKISEYKNTPFGLTSNSLQVYLNYNLRYKLNGEIKSFRLGNSSLKGNEDPLESEIKRKIGSYMYIYVDSCGKASEFLP